MRRKPLNPRPPPPEVPTVCCADCRHFVRDTQGISRSHDGVYFMGVCQKGLTPDTIRKQFANKMRQCKGYKNKF